MHIPQTIMSYNQKRYTVYTTSYIVIEVKRYAVNATNFADVPQRTSRLDLILYLVQELSELGHSDAILVRMYLGGWLARAVCLILRDHSCKGFVVGKREEARYGLPIN